MSGIDRAIESIKHLVDRGVDFIVLGSLVFALKLKSKRFSDDVDVLAFNPDPVFEEDFYQEMADEVDAVYDKTWSGTPKLVFKNGVVLEVYGNFMEFEVPQEFVDECLKWRVRGVEFRSVNVEQNIVLKSRGALVNDKHLRDLKSIARSGEIEFDRDLISRYLGFYEEGTRRAMERILRESGIL